MKKPNPTRLSGAHLRAASSKFILTGLIAAAASLALPASSTAQVSAFPFTLDGAFSGLGEWSDITPVAFISTPFGTTPTTLNDPLRNTLLYAGISHNVASPGNDLQLHLMYDFSPRNQPIQNTPNGQPFASVSFPVSLQGAPARDISVIFQANNTQASFFDIFVDLEVNNPNNPLIPLNSAQFPGLLGFAKIGPSSLSPFDHLLVELEVSLDIPAGFATQPANGGPGLPGNGINPGTGMYDPDPVFWGAAGEAGGGTLLAGGAAGAAVIGLQPATTAIIQINTDGSLTVTPTPEPSSAVLLLGALGVFAARRRKATATV